MSFRLSVKGFKCFDHLELELSGLTLFTGFNGAGKSTAIQTLLLVSQSLRTAPNGDRIDLDGPLLHLGTALDVARSESQGRMSFAFEEDGVQAIWNLTAERRVRYLKVEQATFSADGESVHTACVAAPVSHAASILCEKVSGLTFLGASRLFSNTAWPSPSIITPFGDVGKSGEFAPYWHFQIADEEVAKERRHPDEERTTVRGQVDAYLSQLFPGAMANTDQLAGSDLIRLDLALGSSGWVRPGNIGFGLTYAFPLIVAMLAARPGQLVIVDSPEAHLHPRAQSELGKIVSQFAAAGVRMLVETHSDHFLNGVRLAIKQGTLAPSQASIYFFGGSSQQDHGVQKLNIDDSGEIDHWPPGFFDQAESDLGRLLGLMG
jgi:predicted ATPase